MLSRRSNFLVIIVSVLGVAAAVTAYYLEHRRAAEQAAKGPIPVESDDREVRAPADAAVALTAPAPEPPSAPAPQVAAPVATPVAPAGAEGLDVPTARPRLPPAPAPAAVPADLEITADDLATTRSPAESAAAVELGRALREASGRSWLDLARDPAHTRTLLLLASQTEDTELAAEALGAINHALALRRSGMSHERDACARIALYWTGSAAPRNAPTFEPALATLWRTLDAPTVGPAVSARFLHLLADEPRAQMAVLRGARLDMLDEAPAVVDALTRLAREAAPDVAATALCSMARSFAPEVVEQRVARAAADLALTSPDARVQACALYIWSAWAPPVDVLLSMLDDADPSVRGMAALAIGESGDVAAVHALVELLDDHATAGVTTYDPDGTVVLVWRQPAVAELALEAIATLSAAHTSPFTWTAPTVFGAERELLVRATAQQARDWYGSARDHLPAAHDVAALAPVEPEVPELDVAWALPHIDRAFVAGQRIAAPAPSSATPGGKLPRFEDGTVLYDGPGTSRVKVGSDVGWLPDSLIVPIADPSSPDASRPAPGTLVVTAYDAMLELALVLEEDEDEADDDLIFVRRLTTTRYGSWSSLPPGSYRVVDTPGTPWTWVAVALVHEDRHPLEEDDTPWESGHWLARVLAVTDDQFVVIDDDRIAVAVDRSRVTAAPLHPQVGVGDTVWAPVTGNRLARFRVFALEADGYLTLDAFEGDPFGRRRMPPMRYFTKRPR